VSRQSKKRRQKLMRREMTNRRSRKSGVRARRLAERKQRGQQLSLQTSLAAMERAQMEARAEASRRQARDERLLSESLQTIHLPKKKRSHEPARSLKSHRNG